MTTYKPQIRVIIVDDHPMFILGIKKMLRGDSSISVVGEAHNGKEALEVVLKKPADVILMDVQLPVLGGIDVAKIIQREFPKLKVIIMVEDVSKDVVLQIFDAGTHGCILLNADKDELLHSIHEVYDGKNYYSAKIKDIGMEMLRFKNNINKQPTLSDLQIKILKHLAKGMKTKQIAKELYLSSYSVDAHRKAILRKLNAETSSEAVKIATDRGLI